MVDVEVGGRGTSQVRNGIWTARHCLRLWSRVDVIWLAKKLAMIVPDRFGCSS